MKKIITICSITVMLFIAISSCAVINHQTIRGNGNIVETTIPVSDYNTINLSCSADVIYHQDASQAPYLLLKTDENIVEYLDIKVTNNTLTISTDKDISINPTKHIIHTNSKELVGISIAGSGDISTKGKIITDEIKLSISGSGNININDLDAQFTKTNIAGSGNITLAGKSTKARHSIAGSGDIMAKNLAQDSVTCNISGSGDISVYAINELNSSIAGSGDIFYKGNPKMNNKVAGSGSITSID